MAPRTWTLTNASCYPEPDSSIGPEDVGGPHEGYSIKTSTLRGGLREGVETVEVDNGRLRLVVLPTRGMGLWKAWLGDLEIGWQSPISGPVHPRFVPLMEPGGLGWLEGFDELLARCGLEGNGSPEFDDQGRLIRPLHGRIANRPAQHVDASVDPDSGEIRVRGLVDETRFLFQKLRLTSTIVTKVGATGWRWEDEITNLSATPAEAQLLYHFNVGFPLLQAGAELVAPIKTMVPRDLRAAENIGDWQRYGPGEPGYAEQVYFFDLLTDEQGKSRVLLKNSQATQGVSLRFAKAQLPCFTLWKNTAAPEDGYVTGLEPGTNYPNPRTYEATQGRIVKLAPGETARFDLEVEVHEEARSVARAQQAIVAIQGGAKPRIYDRPQPGWCPE